jgi:hypothetical protein
MRTSCGALVPVLFVPALLAGCPGVDNPEDPANDQEVITTVTLSFSPSGGGQAVTASHSDPENDGDPVIDEVTLSAGTTYDLTITFTNELAEPAEDITAEVAEEGAEHQVFVLGDKVSGPATGAPAGAIVNHAYADEDEGGLPIGLENTIEAVAAGAGELRIKLRHLPEESGAAVKVEGLAEKLATDGEGALPGEVDVDVTFALTVE